MGCAESKPADGKGLNVSSSSQPAGWQGIRAVKIVMIGDKATGKSSIAHRYTKDIFPENITTTIGAAFFSKDVRVDTENNPTPPLLRLQIWDTAGEEMFRAMTRSFFREAVAGVVVYDVTSPPSFNSIKYWLREFRDVCPEAIAIVVGNKIDLDNRRISYDQGSALADSEGALFFEVSAKSGLNVSGVFEEAAKKIVASR